MTHYIPLVHRHVFSVSGDDASHFLQGLMTNDISKVTEKCAIYACMLTPQGKYVCDFFISQWQGQYFLDIGTNDSEAILRKLTMYKLRAKVDIRDVTDNYAVIALIDENIAEAMTLQAVEGYTSSNTEAVTFIDPRIRAIGARAIVRNTAFSHWIEVHHLTPGQVDQYEVLRLSLGVPDGIRDLVPEDSFPLTFNLEAYHAIDFKKGCYIGQEVTARSKYRGSLKKGLFRVKASAPLPEYGSIITAGKVKLGEMLSSHGTIGLALVRLEEWESAGREKNPLKAGDIAIQLQPVVQDT